MDNYDKFLSLRGKYDSFIYDKFEVIDFSDRYEITYTFSIPNLTSFYPKLIIDKKSINHEINEDFLEYLVFNIGMVEVISYVKCTCSFNIIVNCGYLDDEQINWFKKLYYNGLGEFLYRNGIKIDCDDLFKISCSSKRYDFNLNYTGHGNLIPVGGGKDSNVTLELLKDY